MKCFVTGGAGFVGSNLVDRLLKDGHQVTVYDNFSTGYMEFLMSAIENDAYISGGENLNIVRGDILNIEQLKWSMHGHDFVFHMAANADVRFGTSHPGKDLKQNTIGTFNVLEAMRRNDIKKIAFASTGSVYGESSVIPTPEDAPFPVQTSLYGASKLAGEGLIEAYSEGFGMQGWIFRFASILGERYSHGHLFDFYIQLSNNSNKLNILGDGNQKKTYLYVQDCIDGMLCAIDKSIEKVVILNLGADEFITVNESVKIICDHLNVSPQLEYSGGERGWIGDNKYIYLDIKKIKKLGWKPQYTIKESIIKTLDYFKNS